MITPWMTLTLGRTRSLSMIHLPKNQHKRVYLQLVTTPQLQVHWEHLDLHPDTRNDWDDLTEVVTNYGTAKENAKLESATATDGVNVVWKKGKGKGKWGKKGKGGPLHSHLQLRQWQGQWHWQWHWELGTWWRNWVCH